MRVSEFILKKLKPLSTFLNLLSASRMAQSVQYYSLGQQRVLFIFALLILSILYLRFYHNRLSLSSEETAGEIIIEISGEVRNPGIHIFQNPPTLVEAIQKAGGLKAPALLESPLSETLETGTLLTVMKKPPMGKEDVLFSSGGHPQAAMKINIRRMDANKLLTFFIPLDLNRVSVEDLCLIPGIGESLAREIVTYRARRRGFRSIEELKNVKGIGEKKYQSFKDFFVAK